VCVRVCEREGGGERARERDCNKSAKDQQESKTPTSLGRGALVFGRIFKKAERILKIEIRRLYNRQVLAYLPVCLSAHLPFAHFFPFAYLPIVLALGFSSAYLPICPFYIICCQAIYLFIHQPTYPSAHLPIACMPI
jgi:hypothetical protein